MKFITKKNALLVCFATGHFLFAQIDKNATKETINLYKNLKTISKEDEIENFVNSKGLKYYNSDIHKASFALPNFVKSLING